MITKDGRTIDNPISIWLLGNTGVRNPWRIQEGLKVYANSNVVGDLRGVANANKFRQVLADANVIDTDNTKDETGSIGRKWRLAFNQFGFTYPEIAKKDGFPQEELGFVDCITPIGRAFINADTVPAMQECYLRALTVPMVPLPINKDITFSPFCWTLAIMLKVEERTGNSKVNFIEYATCVQTSDPTYDIDEVVDRILRIREERNKADNKKAYDRKLIHEIWARYPLNEINFKDYGDMNLRYMTTSGIAQRAGRGVCIASEKKAVAIELAKNIISSESLKERYLKLCKGAPLPTDNPVMANQVLLDLIKELDTYGIRYTVPNIPLETVANINTVRASLEKLVMNHHEEEYANNQRNNWQEIYEYMNLLIVNNGREKELGDEYYIRVPTSEAPAYLEWTFWRAFLAIDSLINKPHEARRFNIDQDFLPVGTASGNGPDMLFEFNNFVFVVEVTLSDSSRQEAMEGEPVRRHVADTVLKYAGIKPVYGMFIARHIDSNTAETFRIGKWYTKNDEKMSLHIIPFTIEQFSLFFKALFENNLANPENIITLMAECDSYRESLEAPAWKKQIDNIIRYDSMNLKSMSV